MPYVSRSQQAWAHTSEGEKALGGPAKVHEWDEATKGHYGSLPQHVTKGATVNKGFKGKHESFASGGAVLGRSRDFMKEADRFRGSDQPNPAPVKTDEDWDKGDSGGKNAAPPAKGKQLKAVTPKS